MIQLNSSVFRWSLLYVGLFVSGYVTVSGIASDIRDETDGYILDGQDGCSQQVILVYMFHSGCAACNDEDLPTIIETVKVELEKKSVRRSYAFHAIAVAADRLPGTAIEYLVVFVTLYVAYNGDRPRALFDL